MNAKQRERRRRRARPVLLVGCALWLALAFGCSRKRPQPPPPEPKEAAEEEPAPKSEPEQPVTWRNEPAPRPQTAAPASTPEAPRTPDKPKRDLGAELANMLGGLQGCVPPRAEGTPGQASLSVSVVVVGSGMVTRADVGGGQLMPDELACVRGRVSGLHFAAPIEGAPRTVQAVTQVTIRIAAKAKDTLQQDGLGMGVTQAPSGEGVSPGIVPPEVPGIVPPEVPGVVPPADPGVVPAPSPGVVPTPDPPAEVLR